MCTVINFKGTQNRGNQNSSPLKIITSHILIYVCPWKLYIYMICLVNYGVFKLALIDDGNLPMVQNSSIELFGLSDRYAFNYNWIYSTNSIS